MLATYYSLSFYNTLDDWQVGVACTRSANVLFFTGFVHFVIVEGTQLLTDIQTYNATWVGTFLDFSSTSKPASGLFRRVRQQRHSILACISF